MIECRNTGQTCSTVTMVVIKPCPPTKINFGPLELPICDHTITAMDEETNSGINCRINHKM